MRYAKTRVLAFSPDGALVAVASEDGFRIEVLERATEKIRASLRGHKKSVWKGAFSNDGKLFASSDEESIRTWNAVSGEAVAIVPSTGVVRLGFSPGGRLLAVQRENVIQLFQANTGELRQTVAEEEETRGFAFRPDGKLLVTVHGKGKIRVWAAK